MKNILAHAFVAVVGLVLVSGSGLAHHGDAGRYEDNLTTVSGTVLELQLVNPHSIVVVEVTDAKGKTVRWRGELGSPAVLKGWCWSKDTFKTGSKITMTGRRLKNGEPYMTLSENAKVLDATGKEVFRGNEPGKRGEAGPCAGSR